MTRYRRTKHTVDQIFSIDIGLLQKGISLTGKVIEMNITSKKYQNVFREINVTTDTLLITPSIEFNYQFDLYNMKYKYNLIPVHCNFGGIRWYFECGFQKDGSYCGNRVKILYQTNEYFACRTCANLTYKSCNESSKMNKGFKRKIYYLLQAFDYRHKILKRYLYKGNMTKQYKRFIKILEKSET